MVLHAVDFHVFFFFVYRDVVASGYAALTHTTGNYCCVRSHAASCGEDTFRCNHTGQVFRRSLFPNQNNLLAGFLCNGCIIGTEYDLAACRTRRCRKSLSNRGVLLQFLCIKCRVEKLVNLLRCNSHDRGFFIDFLFVHHIYGNLYRSFCRSLTVSGLQHEELALFNRELHILHILVVVLQDSGNVLEFSVYIRERFLHLIDWLRCADTRYNVFTLCVYQELTEDLVLTVHRASCKCNAGAGILTGISEYHGLNVYCRSQGCGNVIQLSVQNCSFVIPGTEYRLNRLHQLILRILWELSAQFCFYQFLVSFNDDFQILCLQINVILSAHFLLAAVKDLIEFGLRDFHYDVTEHLNETSVAVVSKTLVAGLGSQALYGIVIQSQVQNRVHHSRHGNRCAGTNGNQKRILDISELLTHYLFQFIQVFIHFPNDFIVQHAALVQIILAGIGRNSKSERYRQADFCHLCQIGTFTSQKVSHVLGAFIE